MLVICAKSPLATALSIALARAAKAASSTALMEISSSSDSNPPACDTFVPGEIPPFLQARQIHPPSLSGQAEAASPSRFWWRPSAVQARQRRPSRQALPSTRRQTRFFREERYPSAVAAKTRVSLAESLRRSTTSVKNHSRVSSGTVKIAEACWRLIAPFQSASSTTTGSDAMARYSLMTFK